MVGEEMVGEVVGMMEEMMEVMMEVVGRGGEGETKGDSHEDSDNMLREQH